MYTPIEPKFEYALSIRVTLGKATMLRGTPMGQDRGAVYVAEGDFSGPNISGRVVPQSGGDFALVRPDGLLDFDARYLLETDDGTPIYMQNRGFRWASPEVMKAQAERRPVAFSQYYMRVTPRFECPAGKHDWLMRYVFVGVAEKTPEGNVIHYWKVL